METLTKKYYSSTSMYEVQVTEESRNRVKVAIYTEKGRYPVRLELKIAGDYETIADKAWQDYQRFLDKRLQKFR